MWDSFYSTVPSAPLERKKTNNVLEGWEKDTRTHTLCSFFGATAIHLAQAQIFLWPSPHKAKGKAHPSSLALLLFC